MTLYNYVKPLWQNGPIAVHDAPDEVARRIEAAVERGPGAADEDAVVERLVRFVDDPEYGLWIAWVQCEVALQVDASDLTYRRAKFLHAIAATRDALDGEPLTRDFAIDLFRRSYGTRITEGISGQQSLLEQLDYAAGVSAARSLFIDERCLWRAALGEPEPGTAAAIGASAQGAGGEFAEVPTSLNTLLGFRGPNPVETCEWAESEVSAEAPAQEVEGRAASASASGMLGASNAEARREAPIDLPATTLPAPAPEPDPRPEPEGHAEPRDREPEALSHDAPAQRAEVEHAPQAPPESQPASKPAPAPERSRWPHLALAAAALVMIGVSAGFFVGKLGPATPPAVAAAGSPAQSGAAELAERVSAYEARIGRYEEAMRNLEQRLSERERLDADARPASPGASDGDSQSSAEPQSGDADSDTQHALLGAPFPWLH